MTHLDALLATTSLAFAIGIFALVADSQALAFVSGGVFLVCWFAIGTDYLIGWWLERREQKEWRRGR